MDTENLFWERQANEKHEKVPKSKKSDGLPNQRVAQPEEAIQGGDISTATCEGGCGLQGLKNLFVSIMGKYYCKHCYMVLRLGKERTGLIEELEGRADAKT